MKSVVTTVALSVLVTLTCVNGRAQTQNAAPAATPPPAAPAAAAPPMNNEKRPAPRTKRASERADARVCLEFPNNLQIIKCAEKYRYMRGPV